MKRYAFTLAASCAFAVPAFAADMTVPDAMKPLIGNTLSFVNITTDKDTGKVSYVAVKKWYNADGTAQQFRTVDGGKVSNETWTYEDGKICDHFMAKNADTGKEEERKSCHAYLGHKLNEMWTDEEGSDRRVLTIIAGHDSDVIPTKH